MRFSTLSIVVLAVVITVVSAQNFTGIPSCAQQCIKDAIVASGCGMADTACQCGSDKHALITADASPCIYASCTGNDLATTASTGLQLCDEFIATSGSSLSSKASASSTARGSGGTAVITSDGSSAHTGGTALPTSASGVGGSGGSASRSAASLASSSSAGGAAQTLKAGIGGVVGVVGGIIAVL